MKRFVLIVVVTFFLAGCANSDTGSNATNNTISATVVSVKTIKTKGSQTIGRTVGSIAGGAAASTIGKTTWTRILAGVTGALVGGYGGGLAEKAITSKESYEYIVETENGNMITVIQDKNPAFHEGDRVLLIEGSNTHIVADNR